MVYVIKSNFPLEGMDSYAGDSSYFEGPLTFKKYATPKGPVWITVAAHEGTVSVMCKQGEYQEYTCLGRIEDPKDLDGFLHNNLLPL